MAEYLIQDTTLTAIADVIRSKTGSSNPIDPANMAAAIDGIGDVIADMTPAIITANSLRAIHGYNSSSAVSTNTPTVYVPVNANIYSAYLMTVYHYRSSASGTSTKSSSQLVSINTTVDTSDTDFWVVSGSASTNAYRDYVHASNMCIQYSIPGLYIKTNVDGTKELYADTTCTSDLYPGYSIYPVNQIDKVDLSNAQFTCVPGYMFYNTSAKEIILPPSVQTVYNYALASPNIETIDMSRHTSIPTLEAANEIYNGTLLVPSALYDEWKVAANWSAFNVVAV